MAAVSENEVSVARHHMASPETGLIDQSGILRNLMQEILFTIEVSEKAVIRATPKLVALITAR